MSYLNAENVMREAADADMRLYAAWRKIASDRTADILGKNIKIPHEAWKIRTTNGSSDVQPECYVEALPGWDLICMKQKLGWGWALYIAAQRNGNLDYFNMLPVQSLADVGRIVFPDLYKARKAALAQPQVVLTLQDPDAQDDAIFAELLRQARIEIAQYDGIVLPEPVRKPAKFTVYVQVAMCVIALLILIGMVFV